MAIDVRQQELQIPSTTGQRPAKQRQPRWLAVLAALALLAVVAAAWVFVAQPEPVTGYGDIGTSTREAGPYAEPATGYGDIGTSTREAGPYFLHTETDVQTREGGVITSWDYGTDVQTREGGVIVPGTTDVQTREG